MAGPPLAKESFCSTHTIAWFVPLAEMLGVDPRYPKAGVVAWLSGVVIKTPLEKRNAFR